jgi:hypothetical protein
MSFGSRRLSGGLVAVFALLSCKGSDEPAQSYCQALCDWAVSCSATERTFDEAAEQQECLDATHAVDDTCLAVEDGTAGPADTALLGPCVTAIQDASAAGECSAFVGRIDELKVGVTPTECAAQGTDAQATYDAARDATTETGEELCQRFTETFCGRADECVLGDFSGQIPQEATDALGTPFELCVAKLDPAFTAECKGSDLYAQEEDLTAANPPRQAARDCLAGFSSITCEDIFAGSMPKTCAGAFTTADQALAVATALVEVSDEFAAYAQ